MIGSKMTFWSLVGGEEVLDFFGQKNCDFL